MSELDLLLSVPKLLDLVEQFPSISEDLPFTKLFQAGEKQTTDGDLVIFEKVQNDRRLAAIRGPSAEAFSATEPDSVVIKQGMVHSAEKEILTPERLFLRAGKGVFLRSNADGIVVRAVQRIISRLLRTREYVCSQLLQNTAGVAIAPGSAAWVTGANTVTNTVSIQGGLTTSAAGAQWDVATTKMLSAANQLLQFKRAMEGNGHRPYYFLMNQDLEAAITGNLEAQTWLTANGVTTLDAIRRALETGPRVQGAGDNPFEPNAFSGLGGIKSWHTWDHHYTNGAGTVTRYLADGIGIMLPKELDSVLGFAEGPVFIPNTQQVIGNAEQAADLFAVRPGIQVYAYRNVNDTGAITIIGRDTFVPYVKDELGILNITGLS